MPDIATAAAQGESLPSNEGVGRAHGYGPRVHILEDAWSAAATAKLDTQMPEYQQQLGLTNAQTDGLRGVLEGRNERVAEMMRLWESGDRAAAGELKSNEAETYQAELQGVLNQQQVEQFNAMGGGRRGGK